MHVLHLASSPQTLLPIVSITSYHVITQHGLTIHIHSSTYHSLFIHYVPSPLSSHKSLNGFLPTKMPTNPFSISRWLGIFRRKSVQPDNGDEGDEYQFSSSGECYECTQVGVPVFHSTSCERAGQPEWEASAGSSLLPIKNRPKREKSGRGQGGVLDPRTKRVQRWNRAFLLARGMALAVDPLFFYALSIGRGGSPCLYMDGGLAAAVAVLRTCVDAVHLGHLWLQFRLAYVSRESLVVGCGKLVWDARVIAAHYLRSLKGFWFDVFVILPVPQAAFWLLVPRLIRDEQIKLIMTILLLIFLFQFLPKVYHCICLMRRMQKVTGYIFGTIWWGFGLNLIAYFIASHVAGGCWYVLAIQRVASCLKQRCTLSGTCNLSLSCSEEVCYQMLKSGAMDIPCGGGNSTVRKPMCLDVNGPFQYGIYKWALPVVSSNSIAVKILYPIFWGLMTLSTFGNDLEPTSHWLEVMFSICTVLSGLMLFTLLIGNIQVFLHAVMAKKRKMQLRTRDTEWWMKRRQLPSELRQRVRRYEHQKWATLGCDDEMELIQDLPEGLRRDIKRFLCLDLIKKVPIFHSLDDLILDNICDRVQPLVFSKDEKIIREGDPVARMVFIVRGRVKSSQNLSRGVVATCMLEPGGFFGDELMSWCLRRPFKDRLPASSATFTCIESTEAFALDAKHLRYITDHFRYKFANERLTRTSRYYSSNWRTWAAVNIQLAWRRYIYRTQRALSFRSTADDSDRLLRQYAAFFMSIRPHDHLE
ncbi:cyclic nucleotide-gated ion channel 2-like isoform X1 [Salvia miltiorrhiza]|uniref:cyclic nucleotide-gated ion channel 2-like isoform X1 n=1 Tax=Salvia miltiorrhiza TaxID=226208 RepID=UPI0025AD0A39|nr:cyclic nucleotide-gated ion channel 2-like isoform X1 [Salvia miltiorrhiza]